MATIIPRPTADGGVSHFAQVRVKRGGRVVFSQSRSFDDPDAAARWARDTEAAARAGRLSRHSQPRAVAIADLIDRYIREFRSLHQWQRSKDASLRFLAASMLGQEDALTLTRMRILEHVTDRRKAGAGPATVWNDLAWLRVVLRAAAAVWGLPVPLSELDAAILSARQLRLTGRPKRRERRPTAAELERIKQWCSRARIPMADIVDFAVASARRQDEICRIRWDDLDEANHTIVVRDMKDPRRKSGNHVTAKLTDEALKIILRQPRRDARIFPHHADTVSANFTRACQMLGIEDLHFHDLRHEATSRLFEAGYPIHEVAMFTAHRSWQELQRYAQLSPKGVRLR